jgi:Cu/Ag efflux protein CusF
MMRRCFVLTTVAALAYVAAPAFATIAEDVKATNHNGKVLKVEGTSMTMTDKDGKNKHTHKVPATAAITVDGKAAKLADLKEGMPVKVTMEKQGDKTVVTKIEANSA